MYWLVQDEWTYASASVGEIHTCQLGLRWVCFPLAYGSALLRPHPGHNLQMMSVAAAPQGLQKLYHRQWTVYRCLPDTKRAEVHRARHTTGEHNHTRPDEEASPVQPIQSRVSNSIHNRGGKTHTHIQLHKETKNTHKHLLIWPTMQVHFFPKTTA